MIRFLYNRKIQVFIFQIFICSIAFIIFSCLKSEARQDKIPSSKGFINDFEKVFTPPQISNLESLVDKIKKETAMEIAIVTLDSSITNNEAGFDSTTLYISKKWKIGKHIKNNGILIGLSKSMSKVKIQNGYGKWISGEKVVKIVDSIMIPQFKSNNSYEAARLGILALYHETK